MHAATADTNSIVLRNTLLEKRFKSSREQRSTSAACTAAVVTVVLAVPAVDGDCIYSAI
jgi:hypothetical protein